MGCGSSPSLRPAGLPGAPKGFYHTIKPGENLYRIGKRYGVPTDVLIRSNRIQDVGELKVGQRIYIPRRGEMARRSGTVAKRKATPPVGAGNYSELRNRVRAEARRQSKVSFAWPLRRTKLTSRFGRRDGQPHEGIDLRAKQGTSIKAAESGKVIHAGRLGAYGKVVILKHSGSYRSVYAHARKLLVRKGQFVEKSQTIAEVGMTGRTTGPHLHFEIRRKDVPKDPLLYLP
jgi:murein DD-endopeptidase MepM/ murein hydrolase activator NlpD